MTDASFAHGLIGVTLDGRYRLDAVLGEGGMGAVFRATQLAMDRKVAVKLLKPHLTSDQSALERFAREARATLKVESPHAVKVLDFGVTPHRDYYMVLEYLDGRTVQRELVIDGRFAPARVAHIARQALEALAAAHDHGLIHRDVKPDNLLLMRAGSDADYTKVLDFGVAKLMQGTAGEQLALTAAGMVFGTPEYMSPEQACGQPLDGRSDLYSLAVTMFVMLTGTPMFAGATAIEWLTHHVRTPAPRLAAVRPELAAYPELDALLQRCLAKSRDHRPASAAELSARIAELMPALSRAPVVHGAPPPVDLAPTPTRVSSYVAALRDPVPPYAEPTALAAIAEPARGRPVAKRASRRLYVGLGGIALASLIGVAVGLAVRTSGEAGAGSAASAPAGSAQRTPASPAPAIPPALEAAHAETRPAAAPASETRPVVASPSDPVAAPSEARPAVASPSDLRPAVAAPVGETRSVATRPGTSARPSAPPRGAPSRNPEADEHLRNAEDAFRAGKRLRQLTEADLALRADPSSVRAKYLLADALLKDGDSDRGCAYLHEIKRNPQARARARAAGCPDD